MCKHAVTLMPYDTQAHCMFKFMLVLRWTQKLCHALLNAAMRY